MEADSGAIGGSDTHEFMVLADSGEAAVLFCEGQDCEYASNVEKASVPIVARETGEALKPLEEKDTPGCRTVDEVTGFLQVPPQKIIKTLLYETEKEVVAALVRGDREVNEIKLLNELGALRLELAGAVTVRNLTGAAVGFAGPVGLEGVRIIADPEAVAAISK